MGSRIRERPKHLFEFFVEVTKSDGRAPTMSWRFPAEYVDEGVVAEIPKFAFPCETDGSSVDHFSFVVPDLAGMFRFGFCRLATGHRSCLCIVSWLPWFEVFYKTLDHLSRLLSSGEDEGHGQVTEFLQEIYDLDIPAPKVPVSIIANGQMFNFTAPDPNELRKIPGNINLTEYYNALDTANMMLVFASMLQERRIYMTSKKLSRLTSCIYAAEALLYPMNWQHPFIPVLPGHVIECIGLTTPYIIGVHGNLIARMEELQEDLDDAVCVDLDTNTVTTEHDDLGKLPGSVVSSLKRDLKSEKLRVSMQETGDALSMAFLKALVRLIGGVRDALKLRPGEPITFDKNVFVQSRSSQSYQTYLEGMLSLQMFDEFVHGSIESLNAGVKIRGVFEQQVGLYAERHIKKNKNSFKGMKVKIKKQSKRAISTVISGGLLEAMISIPSAVIVTTQKIAVLCHARGPMPVAQTETSGSVDGNLFPVPAPLPLPVWELTDIEEKREVNRVKSGIEILQAKHGKEITLPSTVAPVETLPSEQSQPQLQSDDSQSNLGMRHKKDPLVRESSQDDSRVFMHPQLDLSLLNDKDIQAMLRRSASSEILSDSQRAGGLSSASSSSSLDESDSPAKPRVEKRSKTRESPRQTPMPDVSKDKLIRPGQDKLIRPAVKARPGTAANNKQNAAKPSSLSRLLSINRSRGIPAIIATPIPTTLTSSETPAPEDLSAVSDIGEVEETAGEGESVVAETKAGEGDLANSVEPLILFDLGETETGGQDTQFDPLETKAGLEDSNTGNPLDFMRSISFTSDVLEKDEAGSGTFHGLDTFDSLGGVSQGQALSDVGGQGVPSTFAVDGQDHGKHDITGVNFAFTGLNNHSTFQSMQRPVVSSIAPSQQHFNPCLPPPTTLIGSPFTASTPRPALSTWPGSYSFSRAAPSTVAPPAHPTTSALFTSNYRSPTFNAQVPHQSPVTQPAVGAASAPLTPNLLLPTPASDRVQPKPATRQDSRPSAAGNKAADPTGWAKAQADLLSDLIGVDFGSAGGGQRQNKS